MSDFNEAYVHFSSLSIRSLPTFEDYLFGGVTLEERVKDKIIVITGATDGIGEALTYRLAMKGGRILYVGRNMEKLDAVGAKLLLLGVGERCRGYQCNLSDRKECEKLVQTVLSDFTYIDILVNNAGRSIRRTVDHVSLDRMHDYTRTIDLNYYGPVILTIGFLPSMRRRKSGIIINNSTFGTVTLSPGFSAYSGSKSALNAFACCVDREVRKVYTGGSILLSLPPLMIVMRIYYRTIYPFLLYLCLLYKPRWFRSPSKSISLVW